MEAKKAGKNLNVDVALAHTDGDRQLLAELSAMFLQDYPRLLLEARDSILKNDLSGLERAAHTLKGRLAFFGVCKTRDQVLELENMARRNDLARARQLLAEVETQMEDVLPEFESLAREQNS